jgi:uncharacterized protein (DUF58 family)
MMMPTKTGVGFLGLCFLLYLASMQTTTGLLFMILGVVFGCYVYNFREALRANRRIELSAPPAVSGIEGEKVKGSWTIANTSNQVAGLAQLSSPWGTLLNIGPIAPHDSLTVSPNLSLATRGVYAYRKLQLTSAFPFGLIRASRSLRIDGEIVVYPRVYECKAPVAAGFEPMLGGRFTGRYKSSSGDQFHGVRPMQSYDPFKLIHWPSSSKGQGLMVKEFDEQLSGRVSILVDCSAGRAPAGELLLDWTARAAGSLALAGLDAGHQVELAPLHTADVTSVPPFADSDVVLDKLARLEPTDTPFTPETFDELLERLPKKSSLCLVLSSVARDLPETLANHPSCKRRPISVYVALGQPQPDWPDNVTVHDFGAGAIGEDVDE